MTVDAPDEDDRRGSLSEIRAAQPLVSGAVGVDRPLGVECARRPGERRAKVAHVANGVGTMASDRAIGERLRITAPRQERRVRAA